MGPRGYVLHNSEYAPVFRYALQTDAFGSIVQAANYAFSVPLDRLSDTRHLALFRGLSLEATNKVLALISTVCDAALPAAASEDDLLGLTVPYDSFQFTTQRGETLFYAYCIKSVNDPLPRSVFGPQGVQVYYGPDVLHCGPIWIYKALDQDPTDRRFYDLEPIESSLQDIHDSLMLHGSNACVRPTMS